MTPSMGTGFDSSSARTCLSAFSAGFRATLNLFRAVGDENRCVTFEQLMWAHLIDKSSRRFFLFYIKKNQNFKNICPFRKISKIYPGRPRKGRQDLFVIFFLSICK